MKKVLFFFTLLFLVCLSVRTFAQVNTYTFSQTSGAYSEITGGLFDSATSNSGAASLDDVMYFSGRAIGFFFKMNGIAYTTYSMNTNGQITFGTTFPTSTNYSPISSTVGYAGCIAGLGINLQGIYGFSATRTLASTTLTGVTNFAGIVVGKIVTGTGIPAGTRVTAINTGAGTVDISAAPTAAGTSTLNCCSGELRAVTQGAAGSRVLIVQWKNFQRYGSETLTDNFNFQIRIYETTNIIEVVYGSVTANATAIIPQVGLRGATNADFNNRTSSTTWSASTAGGANTASMTLSSTVFPASGQIYRWTPNDVGTTVILNPVNGGGEGNQAPVATIKNFGINPQSGYNVTCTISPGGYAFSAVAPLLTSGNTANINFPNVTLAANVSYTVTVYTSLPNDQDHSNDTQRVTVSLVYANYGNDSGYFYANTLATPQPSYPGYCWKDTTGSKSLMQNGAITPGNGLFGSLDNGFFILSLKRILLSFGLDTTDKHLKYNGVCYDSIFPGTNGIIGLTLQFSIADVKVDGAKVPKNALLPLWHDANLSTLPASGTNRMSYKVQENQLILTYDRAVSYSPTTDWVSYQVVIEIITGCASPNSNFRYTYADTTNGNTSASFLTNYLAQYPSVPGLVTTFRNYVTGYSQNGAPIVYAGYVSSLNPFPAAPVTQVNIKRPLFNLTTGSGLSVEFGPDINSLNKLNCSVLTVKLAIQGFQNNPIASARRVRDTVTILLRSTISPYPVLATHRVFLDSAYNGVGGYAYGYKDLPGITGPYYIQVKQRNTMLVWSNIVTPVSNAMEYDFTTNINKTFGNNSILINGVAAMYSGDILSLADTLQDGCVTLSDVIKTSNDASVFTSGSYVISDLNYDGVTDLVDVVIVYNNNTNFVCKVQPPGAP